jgi:hypothetical protein
LFDLGTRPARFNGRAVRGDAIDLWHRSARRSTLLRHSI